MTPAVQMIVLVALSAGLRAVFGRRHPGPLVPLVVACAVWFAEAQLPVWRWAFATLGVVISGLTVWIVVEKLVGLRAPRAAE